MRIKLLRLLAAVLVPLLLLTGCWDRREINDTAIVLAKAIDLEEDGMYRISVQVPLPGQMGGAAGGGGGTGGAATYYVDSQAGATIVEAKTDLQQRLSRNLFYSHRRVIIISEAAAKKGINELFDYFARTPENRLSTFVVVVKGKAADYLHIQTQLERFSGEYIRELLNISTPLNIDLKEMLIMLKDKAMDPLLPYLKITPVKSGAKEQKQIQLAGFGQFRDDKMIGVFRNDAAQGLIWLYGFTPYLETIEHGGGKAVSVQMVDGELDIQIDFKNGKPVYRISIQARGQVYEDQVDRSLDEHAGLEELENALNREIKRGITLALEQMQKAGTDNAFLGLYLNRKHPRIWQEEYANVWDERWKEVPTEVQVQVKIINAGMASDLKNE